MSNLEESLQPEVAKVEECATVTTTPLGNQTTVIVNQVKKSNGVGTTGFVFALIGLFLFWIPVLGWILWLVGAVCSTIGLFKSPKGLAIAGFVISFIGLIILVVVAGLLGIAAGLS